MSKDSYITRIAPRILNYLNIKTGTRFNLYSPNNYSYGQFIENPESKKNPESNKFVFKNIIFAPKRFTLSKERIPRLNKLTIKALRANDSNLDRLTKFFKKIKPEKHKALLEFLRTPNGKFQAFYSIKKAMFNEHHKTLQWLEDIGAYDDEMYDEYDTSGGNISLASNNTGSDEVVNDSYAHSYSTEDYEDYDKDQLTINKSVELSNILAKIGLNELSLKVLERIDKITMSLKKKFDWVHSPKLDLAINTLRNSSSNDDEPNAIDANRNSDYIPTGKILEIFKEDLEASATNNLKRDPQVSRLLNSFIKDFDYHNIDSDTILEFFMYASTKGYQKEANEVLLRSLIAQPMPGEKQGFDLTNAETLSMLLDFAIKNKLIQDPEAFKSNLELLRIGKKLPFPSNNSNTDHPETKIPETVNELETEEESELETEFSQDLCSILEEVKEELHLDFFTEGDASKISTKLVEKLKEVKKEDFNNFQLLFDQIFNMNDYKGMAEAIYESNIFFNGETEAFGLFNLHDLLNIFIDSNSKFNTTLHKNFFDKNSNTLKASVTDLIKTFNNSQEIRNNKKVESTNETIRSIETKAAFEELLDKINLNNYTTLEIAKLYLSLVEESNVPCANTLLDSKIENVFNMEDSPEKLSELIDLLEISQYAFSKGFLSPRNLTNSNEITETYFNLISSENEKFENGFKDLLKIIKDESLNPHYSLALIYSLTKLSIENNDLAAKLFRDDAKQSQLLEAIKERVFLPKDRNTELINKRKKELPDIINFVSALFEFKILKDADIKNFRKQYGQWEIVTKTDTGDIPYLFNEETQELIFKLIPKLKFQSNDLKTLIHKAFEYESNNSSKNLEKLKNIIQNTLSTIPIISVNAKQDLELCHTIMSHILPFDSIDDVEKFPIMHEKYLHRKAYLSKPQKLKTHRSNKVAEDYKKFKTFKEQFRSPDFKKDVALINKPILLQSPPLSDSEDLEATLANRIYENYQILADKYQDMKTEAITKDTLELLRWTEVYLDELGLIDSYKFVEQP